MAVKQSSGGRRNDVAGYWDRLAPEFEFEYGNPTRDGDAANEVTVYDDRQDIGQRDPGIKVQFKQNGRRRKIAVFTFDDAADIDELIADLQSARDAL